MPRAPTFRGAPSYQNDNYEKKEEKMTRGIVGYIILFVNIFESVYILEGAPENRLLS